MWRRLAAAHFKTLTRSPSSLSSPWRSTSIFIRVSRSSREEQSLCRYLGYISSSLHSSSSPSPFQKTTALSSQASTDAENILSMGKKKVEDVMPIATGHEREELEAELEGKKRFDLDAPVGPFGTKEAPAIIQSYYDKRIVGCPGGEGEDEHDVIWFWLEKDRPHECPVCSQYFQLEVIGEGGPPDGHGDDEH